MADDIDLKGQLKSLISLQEIDSEIYDLQIEKETFPGKVREMDSVLEQKMAGMKSAEDELKKLQVAKNEKENDLASNEEKIKKHDTELTQIKTNKEYKAMLDQIGSLKADVSLLEEKIIGLLDEIAAAQSKWEEEKKLFEEEEKKDKKEKEEIKSREREIDAHLDKLKGKKKELTKAVDGELLATYEKILENRGRHALAKVNGEFCDECNMRLRPQIINDAKLQKGLVICENCSRILYTEEP